MSAPDFTRAHWIKSSFSEAPQRECIELATADSWIGMRDSKLGNASPILTFSRAELKAFLVGVKNNEFAHLTTEP